MTEDHCLRRAAVEQSDRDSAVGGMPNAALSFDKKHFAMLAFKDEAFGGPVGEIGNRAVNRNAATCDDDTRLTRGYHFSVPAAPRRFGGEFERDGELAQRAIAADGGDPFALGFAGEIFSATDSVGHAAYIPNGAAIFFGSVSERGIIPEKCVQTGNDVETSRHRTDEKFAPGGGQFSPHGRDADKQGVGFESERFAESGDNWDAAADADDWKKIFTGNSAIQNACDFVRAIAEDGDRSLGFPDIEVTFGENHESAVVGGLHESTRDDTLDHLNGKQKSRSSSCWDDFRDYRAGPFVAPDFWVGSRFCGHHCPPLGEHRQLHRHGRIERVVVAAICAFMKSFFRSPRYPKTLLGVFAVWFAVWAIHPSHPRDFILEHLLTVVFVAFLIWNHRRFRLSHLSYTTIFVFMCLHVVGAHYTYAEVPYERWFATVCDWVGSSNCSFQSLFGFERNHYDRLVHFSFGLTMAYPVREIFVRIARARGFWGYFLPLDVMMSFSLLYELLEWWITLIVAPDVGQSYLGTQGDVWDAQKDCALATLGGLIAMTTTALVNARYKRDFAEDFWESLRVKRQAPLGEVEFDRMTREENKKK